jgi:hypothetical protein
MSTRAFLHHRRRRAKKVASLCASLAVAMATASAQTAEFQQADKHEHGHVQISAALQGEQLVIEMEAPAINVVGFERAPRTDAERKLLAEQLAWLRSGQRAVGVAPAARCRLQSIEVTEPEWSHQDHDHDHDHDRGAKEEEKHADFRARWRFRCANAAALAWIEPWLLRSLRDVTDADVRVVAGNFQSALEVSSATQRVPLR